MSIQSKAAAVPVTTITANKPVESVARLQRAVLRLALPFQGQSPELDAQLKDLGRLLRGGRRDDNLQKVIESVVDTITSLDIDLSSASASKPQKSCPVADVVEQLKLPNAAHRTQADLVALLNERNKELETAKAVTLAAEKLSELFRKTQDTLVSEALKGQLFATMDALVLRADLPSGTFLACGSPINSFNTGIALCFARSSS